MSLDPSVVQSALRTQVFGRQLIVLPQTGSTNDVAREMAAGGAPEGTVVAAEEQTAGRGRMGRLWSAPSGACLLCSILFRPDLPLHRAAHLTMICALAASDALFQVAGLVAALKWPNDLVVVSDAGWHKLAGVLTETSVIGERIDLAVVGVGINVNVPPEELAALAPDATSVLAEVGRETDRAALLAAFLNGVEARYRRAQAGQSPQPEWAARLATLGQTVHVTGGDGTIVGLAEAVDEDGALLVRTATGALQRLVAGDVTLSLRPAGRST